MVSVSCALVRNSLSTSSPNDSPIMVVPIGDVVENRPPMDSLKWIVLRQFLFDSGLDFVVIAMQCFW